MAKSKEASSQEFWSSDRAVQIVREHLVPEWSVALGEPVEWSPVAGEEVWQALSREVRERAHRGHHQPGFQLITTAFDDAKHDAGVYGQLRTRLFAFAHLLRTWRLELTAAHGSDCWDRVLPTIHDPKERVVVELLRQTSARTIDDVVNDLDRQGREGFTYQLAGQDPIRMTPTDCGIDLFVEAARRFDKRLHAKKQTVPETPPMPTGDDSNTWPRVLYYIESNQITLTRRIPESETKPEYLLTCVLTGPKLIQLFWALIVTKGRISRKDIYMKFTHKEDHAPGGKIGRDTLNKVTQIRQDFDRYLTKHLGPHPVTGKPWISKGNKRGYCFTAGVKFQPGNKDFIPDK